MFTKTIKKENKMISKSKRKALTLTEVLISIGIIGVISAITIPALLTNSNEAKLKLAWKHDFNLLRDAFDKSLFSYGGKFAGVCSGGPLDTELDCIASKFTNNLTIVRTCGPTDTGTESECLYSTSSTLRFLDGSPNNDAWYAKVFTLNNGSIVWVGAMGLTLCDSHPNNTNVNACGGFFTDVNGLKGPNVLGRDVFGGWITNEGLLPWGALDQNNTAAPLYNKDSCSATNEGWGCALKALSDQE